MKGHSEKDDLLLFSEKRMSMNIKDRIAEKGEKLIGTWTINCIPFQTGRMLGKLYVTDKSLYYDAQFDMSIEGVIENLMTSAISATGHPLIVSREICDQWKSKGYLELSKDEIEGIEEQSSFFKKKITLILKDKQTVAFDYGMLSVRKLKDAIES